MQVYGICVKLPEALKTVLLLISFRFKVHYIFSMKLSYDLLAQFTMKNLQLIMAGG